MWKHIGSGIMLPTDVLDCYYEQNNSIYGATIPWPRISIELTDNNLGVTYENKPFNFQIQG